MSGFTLIEIMVAIVIVGVLSALAIPAYQNYIVRGQISEGINLLSGAKINISEYYSNHGKYPIHVSQLGFNSAVGNYVEKLNLGNEGRVYATFNNANSKIANRTISLIPKADANNVLRWQCVSNLSSQYLPTSCDSVKNSAEEHLQLNDNPAFFKNRYTFVEDGIIYGKRLHELITIDEDGTKFYRNSETGKELAVDKFGTLKTTNLPTANTGLDVAYYWGDTSFTSNEQFIYKGPDGNDIVVDVVRLNVNDNNPYFLNGSDSKIALQKLYDAESAVRTAALAGNHQEVNNTLALREQARKEFTEHLSFIQKQYGGKLPDDYPLSLRLSEYYI